MLLNRTPDRNEEAFQTLLLILGDALRCKLTGKRLKRRTNLKDLIDVADRYARNIGSAPRNSDDIALLLELSDCLSHGCPTDEQFICEIVLLQPFAGL